MLISVIVRTKDEAGRLRLVLASLSRQTVPLVKPGSRVPEEDTAAELIVVNDGSSDRTPAVIDEAAGSLPLCAVHNRQARGPSAASNAGACQAAGEVLFFLDGDALAAPRVVESHARRQAAGRVLARGELYHLRSTRFFLDPETGVPQPGQEVQVRRRGVDLASQLVTRQQVLEHFEEIEARAQPGIYPGAGPRKLAELEYDALCNHPGLSVLWMAASGHNFSVRRHDFEAVGGFDECLNMNEHRELAFRLAEHSIPITLVKGAATYHLTHRIGWRDPLEDTSWERVFYDAHPCLAVKLMSIFWLSVGGTDTIPVEARINSLPDMDAIVRRGTAIDYDAIRRAHPHLADLSEPRRRPR
jgi:glycosyltransferase involved in cell wall biosynthesis